MSTLAEKLRSSGNSLIDRLRGIETPQTRLSPTPQDNTQNEAIFEEIRGLKSGGTSLSKIKKAIDVMKLPNAEEVKNFARNLFFNTELTPSDNKLTTQKSVIKDKKLEKENNILDEDITLDFNKFKENLSNKLGINIDKFKNEVEELKESGIGYEDIVEVLGELPSVKNKKMALKIIKDSFKLLK